MSFVQTDSNIVTGLIGLDDSWFLIYRALVNIRDRQCKGYSQWRILHILIKQECSPLPSNKGAWHFTEHMKLYQPRNVSRSRPKQKIFLTHDQQCRLNIQCRSNTNFPCQSARIILGMCSANERRHYHVTWSLIGWNNVQNDPWGVEMILTHVL